MKKEKVTLANFAQDLHEARNTIRKFKFAFAGTPEKNLKAYRQAKKKVAQLLTLKELSK